MAEMSGKDGEIVVIVKILKLLSGVKNPMRILRYVWDRVIDQGVEENSEVTKKDPYGDLPAFVMHRSNGTEEKG